RVPAEGPRGHHQPVARSPRRPNVDAAAAEGRIDREAVLVTRGGQEEGGAGPLPQDHDLRCRGLDLAKEVEIVDGLALGDTLLFERGREFLGFAVYHTPGVSEAPAGALYVKFLALDPQHKRVENLEQSLAAVEEAAAEIGVQRVILPVYTRYWSAYSTLIKWGYQVDFTMVRMQRGKQEDYEDSTHLVLDDWR